MTVWPSVQQCTHLRAAINFEFHHTSSIMSLFCPIKGGVTILDIFHSCIQNYFAYKLILINKSSRSPKTMLIDCSCISKGTSTFSCVCVCVFTTFRQLGCRHGSGSAISEVSGGLVKEVACRESVKQGHRWCGDTRVGVVDTKVLVPNKHVLLSPECLPSVELQT